MSDELSEEAKELLESENDTLGDILSEIWPENSEEEIIAGLNYEAKIEDPFNYEVYDLTEAFLAGVSWVKQRKGERE